MDKRKIFNRLNEFTTNTNQGANWIGFIKQFFPNGSVITESASIQILISAFHLNIPTYVIVIFVITKYYLMMIVNYIVGDLAKRIGIWKYSNEYATKQEHLAPWNVETRQTLEAICKKLRIKSKYKKL